MRIIYCLLMLVGALGVQAQMSFMEHFSSLKSDYPAVPDGLVEAVAYHASRWEWIEADNSASCSGKPVSVGFLGVIDAYNSGLNANGRILDSLSPWTIQEILNDAEVHIRAWLHTIQVLAAEHHSSSPEDWLWLTLMLSEIPFGEDAAVLPQALWLQETAYWWNRLTGVTCDLSKLLPLPVLEQINGEFIQINRFDQQGVSVIAAPSCNKGSRNGTSVSAVVVHVAQGTYAGTIAWFLNCQSSVSAHYVIRSSDGQITQMVAESERAFHVGSENPYTVGIEHEGYVSNPTWFTDTLYKASAWLSSGICSRHGIATNRTAWWPWTAGSLFNQTGRPGSCTRIKGHQHYPNQTHTDPGPHWDWERYYRLLNPAPGPMILSGMQGSFTWPASGLYGNDIRILWRIGAGVGTVTLSFSTFDTELNWDYVFAYDGPDINSPILGVFSGNSIPASISGQSGYITLEFRSDCAVTAQGFQISWETHGAGDSLPPVSSLVSPLNTWVTESFEALYTDVFPSVSQLGFCGFLPVSYDGSRWAANSKEGVFYDDFAGNSLALHPQWNVLSGSWIQSEGKLLQTSTSVSSGLVRAIWEPLNNRAHLLTTRIRWHGVHPERTISFLLYGTAPDLPYLGNSLCLEFKPAAQLVTLYRSTGGQKFSLANATFALNGATWYSVRIFMDETEGRFRLWINNQLVLNTENVGYPHFAQVMGLSTAHCAGEFGEFSIYRERNCNSSQWVQAGTSIQSWLPNQSINPDNVAARLFAISLDASGKLSSRNMREYKVDYTPPNGPDMVFNGGWEESDTIIGSFWPLYFPPANDSHSGILYYEVSLGSDSCLQDTHSWHEAQDAPPALINLPEDMQAGARYFPGIRAVNGAGLKGSIICGKGAVWQPGLNTSGIGGAPIALLVPNPGRQVFKLIFPMVEDEQKLKIVDVSGRSVKPESIFYLSDGILFRLPEGISPGSYFLIYGDRFSISFIVMPE
jgi:hypothetical protein